MKISQTKEGECFSLYIREGRIHDAENGIGWHFLVRRHTWGSGRTHGRKTRKGVEFVLDTVYVSPHIHQNLNILAYAITGYPLGFFPWQKRHCFHHNDAYFAWDVER